LDKAENIVDEEEDVEMFFVAEILGDGQAGQADAKTSSGWLGHLSIDEGGPRLFGVSWDNHVGFLEFLIKVVPFAGAFTDASEHRDTTVFHSDVMN